MSFFSRLSRPNGRRRRRSREGIALLMAITSIVFITVLVTEVNYGARVRLLRAAHSRDEMASVFLARTGVSLQQLLLILSKQAGSQFSQFLGGQELWQMLPPLNTGLLRMFFGSESGDVEEEQIEEFATTGKVDEEIAEASREEASKFSGKGFLDFEGDFMVDVTGEDCRINVNRLANSCNGACSQAILREDPTALQLYGVMSGQDNDQWFYERNLDRWDLIANLADWIDQDSMRSSAQGGYEDNLYNRVEPPYLSKNAKFDTREEIRLVDGWQDDVFEKFGGYVTTYGSGKININCADPDLIQGLFKSEFFVPPMTDQQAEQFYQQMTEYQLLSSFASGKDFVSWVKNQGKEVKPTLESAITTQSTVFTVVSTGTVGDTSARITAVMDFQSSSSGRIRYWRVD